MLSAQAMAYKAQAMADNGIAQYVNPMIGAKGVGRTFPGPCMPFGMVKPGPDCVTMPNSGWAPIPEPVAGFSQIHVSGTGGGQKYGNILIQPFRGELKGNSHPQRRVNEQTALGYYSTTYDTGILTEITTDERCALYRFTNIDNLLVDCGFFLGEKTMPDTRESQQFVGSEIEVVSDHEVRGHSTIRGGWNNGSAYTVYFCLVSAEPFSESKTFRSKRDTIREDSIVFANTKYSDSKQQPDMGNKTGALLRFKSKNVNVKVGISFVSALKAKQNISPYSFDEQLLRLRSAWEKILSRVSINRVAKKHPKLKEQFYTALYHTMIMPVDRTGENPAWAESPYYDDYYAIWDTYRTSTPLITLLEPERQRDIVNSLLNIYKREGYMPDARSGNCNGRTQGGSNAEVVIADAFVKGLKGIDYELALEAMIKDATCPPGGNEEKEGRGGLREYLTLGYIPYGIPRAGNRTIEYAYDDYCIATVAKGLGYNEIYQKYLKQSGNWKNLWRSDYEFDSMRGFIMPKAENGEWLDSVVWGKSEVYSPKILYTPTTKVAPWYIPWWDTFFYEATAEEYSLSIPHDVRGLIAACGGSEAFRQRLDLFFEKGYYNVGNEPSFLTPCLYHWIGRADLSSQCVSNILNRYFMSTPDSLPGNDDSGAMSAWFAFHALGIYPNAGQSHYLLHTPLVNDYTIALPNGNTLKAKVKGNGSHFDGATLNGKELKGAFISHDQLLQGGELVFYVSTAKEAHTTNLSDKNAKTEIKHTTKLSDKNAKTEKTVSDSPTEPLLTVSPNFVLNKQFRTWPVKYAWLGDTLIVNCNKAVYHISRSEVDHATGFCWHSPAIGTIYNNVEGTFGFISNDAYESLLKSELFKYNGITWRKTTQQGNGITVKADVDHTIMTIKVINGLPIVTSMQRNPLGIDWKL